MVNILEEACGSELEEVLVRPLAETCGFGRGVMASGLPLWGWMRLESLMFLSALDVFFVSYCNSPGV